MLHYMYSKLAHKVQLKPNLARHIHEKRQANEGLHTNV